MLAAGLTPRPTLMSVYDLSTTDALLSTTRSVRRRLDTQKPVPRDIIDECLSLSMQAPTGSNEQDWGWIVVTDAKKRAALADFYNKGARPYLLGGDPNPDIDPQTRRVFSSAVYLMKILKDVPVHVIPCISALPEDASRASWASSMGSIFPAVWSFNLALRARGLGTVLTTLHLGYEKQVAELLGIPDEVMQVGLLPVAYTKGTDFKPVKRKPLDDIVHWERW